MNNIPRGLFLGACALLSLLSGCATTRASQPRLLEDSYGRYYTTQSGQVLRVEKDGAVLDVSCLPLGAVESTPLSKLPQALCPGGKIAVLGKAGKVGERFDLSAYGIAKDGAVRQEPDAAGWEGGGLCRPLFPDTSGSFPDWSRSQRWHSCWNRIWEVPAAIVLYPAVVGVAVGVITSPIWVPLIFHPF